jgi:hypothetical protein
MRRVSEGRLQMRCLQVHDRKSVAIRAGLEATCVLLRLCSCPSCPRHLLQQDSLDACCKLVAEQTRGSLLVFFDAHLQSQLWHQGDHGREGRPKCAPPTARCSCRRT